MEFAYVRQSIQGHVYVAAVMAKVITADYVQNMTEKCWGNMLPIFFCCGKKGRGYELLLRLRDKEMLAFATLPILLCQMGRYIEVGELRTSS